MAVINNRRTIDPSEHTDFVGNKELRDAAARTAFSYDAIAGLTDFTVTVLSVPLPLGTKNASTFFGNQATGSASTTVSGFYFYGRIKGEGFVSPHEVLPNPCEVTFADPYLAAKVAALHTTFISAENSIAEGSTVPKIGDEVRVSILPGDFKLDLQRAYFSKIKISSEPNDDIQSIANCTNLQSTLSSFDYENVGEIDASVARLGNAGATLDPNGTVEHGNYTNIVTPIPETFGSIAGTILEKIAAGDPSIWPAKVYKTDGTYVEANQFYAPMAKGLRVGSALNTARTITIDGVESTSAHIGIDIGTGAYGDQPLYNSLPGYVYSWCDGTRITNVPERQPQTTKTGTCKIISAVEFADGTRAIITTRHVHASQYFDIGKSWGDFVSSNGQPVCMSGGAKGQVGSGGTTGPHLHWEVGLNPWLDEGGTITDIGTIVQKSIEEIAASPYFKAAPKDGMLIYRGATTNPTNGSTTMTGAPSAPEAV